MNRFLPVFLLFLIAFASAHAKRSGPAKVEPIIHEGVRYEAPNENGRRAIIRASDAKTGKQLWEKEIFTVTIKPDLEQDVQWVFIKRLSIEQQKLIIVATNGKSYALNLDTREVLKLD